MNLAAILALVESAAPGIESVIKLIEELVAGLKKTTPPTQNPPLHKALDDVLAKAPDLAKAVMMGPGAK
jgi:hypothetical protein